MVMLAARRLLFILLLIISAASCAAHDLPSRQECIVRVKSLAPDSTAFQAKGLHQLMVAASKNDIPLAGYTIPNDATAYLQFKNHCQKRFAYAKRLFSGAFPNDDFEIDHRKVKPSTKTIDIVGPYWSDGGENWPPDAQ